jgi:hypothetical protein
MPPDDTLVTGSDVADLESMFSDDSDTTIDAGQQDQGQQGTQTQQNNGSDELLLDENGEPIIEAELDENGNPVVQVSDDVTDPVVLEVPDDHKVVLNVDGKDVEYTFGDLKAGAQKYAAANQRFEEAAAIRKEYTDKAATLSTREQQLGQVLQHYITESTALMQAQEPKWGELLANDPQKYLTERHNWEIKMARLNEARQVQANVERMQAEQRQASILQRRDEEAKKLPSVIPEWADPKKAAEGAMEVGRYLESVGIPREMQDQIDTVAVLNVARKAMLYDRAIAKQAAARKAGGAGAGKQGQQQAAAQQQGTRRQQQPRVERPGAATAAQTQASRQNLSKANATKAFMANPSVDTLAGLFE